MIDDQVDRLMFALGLTPYANTRCGVLSGGNKRKLMLASCMIGGPKVLFLDGNFNTDCTFVV